MSKDSHPFRGASVGAFRDCAHEKYNKIIWLIGQFGGYTAHQFNQGFTHLFQISIPTHLHLCQLVVGLMRMRTAEKFASNAELGLYALRPDFVGECNGARARR